MKNAMQLKAIMKNMSKEKKVSAQLLLQNYMLERLLERIALSDFNDKFILKGGFLIAAMVGLNTRATMDMDATIKGYPVTESTIREMFENICKIEFNDDIVFSFNHIEEIREGDVYTGYRVSVTANYPPMAVPLKLDITTGDIITPRELVFEYPLMFENRKISVLAYPPETILAEKLETVISRSDQNTRPRDYYDIYILYKLQKEKINFNILKNAIEATSTKRGSLAVLQNYEEIIKTIITSDIMQIQWKKYQKDFTYAQDIIFEDICEIIKKIMNCIYSL